MKLVTPLFRAVQNDELTTFSELQDFLGNTPYWVEEEFRGDRNPWLVLVTPGRETRIGRLDFLDWLVHDTLSDEVEIVHHDAFSHRFRVMQ